LYVIASDDRQTVLLLTEGFWPAMKPPHAAISDGIINA